MRLFIASNFPERIIHDLNERVTALRPRLPAASWVRPETQHLTYAFLGEQDLSLVERLTAPLVERLRSVGPFEASLHGCGVFPNPRHARVGWIGLQPEGKFGEIARGVREVVTSAGVTLDRADFKPHLTLMRMRDSWPPRSIELFTQSLREYRSEAFTVNEVTLYSSQLDPKGAIHTPLAKLAL